MGLKTLDNSILRLKKLVAIQDTDGIWNYNSYNLGLANGVRVALGILEGKEPKTLVPPDEWLEDSGNGKGGCLA